MCSQVSQSLRHQAKGQACKVEIANRKCREKEKDTIAIGRYIICCNGLDTKMLLAGWEMICDLKRQQRQDQPCPVCLQFTASYKTLDIQKRRRHVTRRPIETLLPACCPLDARA